MTSESKILTVSYGTFSCTLEGFDDPFNTMKAIAEYFRDLAAEDRYFGAEPAQPDAAMLHRIAEREVARLVDSKVHDNGVFLRPQDPLAKAAPAEPASRPVGTGVYGVKGKAATSPAPAEPSLQDVIPDGVAAKLARIRLAVNPPLVTPPLPDEIFRSFDAAAENAGLAEPSEAQDEQDDDRESVASAPGQDVLSRIGALIHAPDALMDVAPSEHQSIAEEPGSIANPPLDVEPDPGSSEMDAPDAHEENADAALDRIADNGGAILNDATAPDATEPDPAEPDAAEPDAAEEDTTIAAELLPDRDADNQTGATLEDTLPEDAAFVPESLVEALADEPIPEMLETATAVDAPSSAPAVNTSGSKSSGRSKRVSSRVVRIHPDEDDSGENKPSDPNATRIVTGSAEDAELSRLLQQADEVMAGVETRRRQDSIAHLKAAVVATEADRALTGEAKPAPTKKLDPYRDDLAQVVQPDPEPAPPAADVRPRRKTVSVRPQEPRPGTIRPGMISPPPLVLVSEQRIDRVPPALAPAAPAPQREGQPVVALRTGRLTGAIGNGAAAPSPVLPHQKVVLARVSQAASAEIEDEDDFDEDLSELNEAGLASFAERMGAKSMADMLEAAAAYATCVENRSQFTRPQLMRRLMASAGDRSVSREDGLRSFGTLLRTGRIEKVGRGHYTLADTSPYLAEARRYS